MYQVKLSHSAKKALKKLGRSGSFDSSVLRDALSLLEEGKFLPAKYKDHQLQGEFVHLRECHLGFNLLLTYRRNEEKQIITISDIGTHDELFS